MKITMQRQAWEELNIMIAASAASSGEYEESVTPGDRMSNEEIGLQTEALPGGISGNKKSTKLWSRNGTLKKFFQKKSLKP